MAASTVITIDTTPPQAPAALIDGGAASTSVQAGSVDFSTSDPSTAGYEVVVWGDLAGGPTTEAGAAAQPYVASAPISLSPGTATKTVNARIIDDVGNQTNVLTDTIQYNASQNYVLTAADAAAFTDVAGQTESLARSAADSTSLTDASVRVAAHPRAAADAVATSDVLVRAAAHTRAAADAVGASDTTTRAVARARVLSDSLAAADVVSRAHFAARAVTESLSVGESASRGPRSGARAVADGLSAADVASALRTQIVAAADMAGLSDAATRGSNAEHRVVADSVAAADAVTRVTSRTCAAADTLSIVVAAQCTLGRNAPVADAAGAADVAYRATNRARVITDNTALADVTARQPISQTQMAHESMTVSEWASGDGGHAGSVSDALVIIDVARKLQIIKGHPHAGHLVWPKPGVVGR